MAEYVGAIDQGTTSTRFVVVDEDARFVAMAQKEHRQVYPQPGWVEHNPTEIWDNTRAVISEALEAADIAPADLAAIGITNQRETTVAWSRTTGLPLTNAIVWQDTRTADLCRELGGDGGPNRFADTTGLPLATYFSAPKMKWLLETSEAVSNAAADGDLAFGTVDSWLAWNLTGRHVTDVTNASRTLLMDIELLSWSDEVADAIGVPVASLPEIVPSSGRIGECRGVLDGVSLSGVLGDQQAALFGQACFREGQAKNTYGTGCFLLVNTGRRPLRSDAGLLTTVAYQLEGQEPIFALEGSVAIAGAAVQWLRDGLGLIEDASEIEAMAAEVPDNGDVYFVPAFSGLFAPYWRDDARGAIVGLTRFANRGHLARATLEATAFQTFDVVRAMESDAGVRLQELNVDGGMAANDLLLQFQADILDADVIRPEVRETTVLGAAYAAGLAEGVWSSTDDLVDHWREDGRFSPDMSDAARRQLLSGWARAVEKSMGWVES